MMSMSFSVHKLMHRRCFFRCKVSEVIMKMQKSCELSMGNWIWFPAQIDNLCINEHLKEWIYITVTIPASLYFALLFYINVKIYLIFLYYLVVVIIVVYYFA